MADKPSQAVPLRTRAPDTAADLGLYAAPLALGVPVMVAAAATAPVQAAALPPAASAQADPAAAKAASAAFGWWNADAGTDAGASTSLGPAASQPAGAAEKAGGDGDGGAAKVVVIHDAAGLPPAMPPLTNVDPVPRAEAGEAPPATPQIEAGTAATAATAPDLAGLAALNAIGTLTAGAVGQAADAVGALVIDAAGLAEGVLQSTTGLVAETIEGLGNLVSDLGALGGSDPLGGIATLVEMVGSAELLAVSDIAASGEGLLVSIGDAGDGLGEALAAPLDLAEAPADLLLGADAQHGPLGLLAGLTDDTI